MNNTEKLINTKNAYLENKETENLFNLSLLEEFKNHYDNCNLYKKYCNLQNKTPENVKNFKEIPFLYVDTLKEVDLISTDRNNIYLTLTSSGTSGLKTKIYLDKISFERIKTIVNNIFSSLNLKSEKEHNYLNFTYDIKYAKDIGTAFSDEMLTHLTKQKEIFYVIKYDKKLNKFTPDMQGALEKLLKFSNDKNTPTRILGFPAYLYTLYTLAKSQNIKKIPLNKESIIITGGGWKQFKDKKIEKTEFKLMLSEFFEIDISNIRDLFGLTEHGIPYVECEYGHFHVPIYSKVIIRNPYNLQEMKEGEIGLIHFYTSYIHSYPSISLLSSDLGSLHYNCKCNRNTPYLKIEGRAGHSKFKGCALTAEQLL